MKLRGLLLSGGRERGGEKKGGERKGKGQGRGKEVGVGIWSTEKFGRGSPMRERWLRWENDG